MKFIRATRYDLQQIGVGVCSILFAVLSAVAILYDPHPVLFVLLAGGLFVVMPGVLGIALINEHRRLRKNTRPGRSTQNKRRSRN